MQENNHAQVNTALHFTQLTLQLKSKNNLRKNKSPKTESFLGDHVQNVACSLKAVDTIGNLSKNLLA